MVTVNKSFFFFSLQIAVTFCHVKCGIRIDNIQSFSTKTSLCWNTYCFCFSFLRIWSLKLNGVPPSSGRQWHDTQNRHVRPKCSYQLYKNIVEMVWNIIELLLLFFWRIFFSLQSGDNPLIPLMQDSSPLLIWVLPAEPLLFILILILIQTVPRLAVTMSRLRERQDRGRALLEAWAMGKYLFV